MRPTQAQAQAQPHAFCRPAHQLNAQEANSNGDSVVLGSIGDQANSDMETLRRQAEGKQDGNFFQRGMKGLGNSAGRGLRSLSGTAGEQVNKTIRNPLRWLPGASAAASTADFLGLEVPGDKQGLPGTRVIGAAAESTVRGVGAFGADTVESVSQAAAHPVQTTVGLAKLAEAVQTDTPIGMATTAVESVTTGRSYLEVRSEKREPVNQAVSGIAKDFQKNREEIGLPGAAVKTGLDLFGLPKAALKVGAKLGRLGKKTKAAEEAVDSRPIWLRMHRETPTEAKSMAAEVAPQMRQRADELLKNLDSGDKSVFHATTSDALKGLSESGELLSAKAMSGRNLERASGEGTAMWAKAERDWVSLAEGSDGFGSALRYHDNLVEAPYSYGKLDDAALRTERARMESIVNHPTVENSIPGSQDLAKSRLNDMDAEVSRRASSDGPRDLYPVMFGFRRDGLELNPSRDIPGEVRSSDSVSLAKNLESVIAPQSKAAEISEFLERTLGPDHGVKFISSEAIHQAKSQNISVHHNFVRMGDGVGADTNRDLDVAYDLVK